MRRLRGSQLGAEPPTRRFPAGVRGLPELFALRVKARSLAYLYVAGAILGLLTLALPHGSSIRDRPIWILASIAIAIGTLVYFRAEANLPAERPEDDWSALCGGRAEIHRVPGDHLSALFPPHVAVLGARLEEILERPLTPPLVAESTPLRPLA